MPMQKHPILYSFRRCPYAMRARMALLASGQPVILREVLLRDKPEALIEISSKGTVPVLLTPDALFDESLDIMQWALEQSDHLEWLNHRNDALIDANDGPFKEALDHYKYPTRYDLKTIEEPRASGLEHLHDLNRRLENTAFLAGNRPGFTDIAIFPFVRQFSKVDERWFETQNLPALKIWLDSLIQSEVFQSAMVKHPPWQPGDPKTLFP